jgi:hypothetical protein
MKKTPEELLTANAQQAEQNWRILLQHGVVRVMPAAERTVTEEHLRILQQQELEYSRTT